MADLQDDRNAGDNVTPAAKRPGDARLWRQAADRYRSRGSHIQTAETGPTQPPDTQGSDLGRSARNRPREPRAGSFDDESGGYSRTMTVAPRLKIASPSCG